MNTISFKKASEQNKKKVRNTIASHLLTMAWLAVLTVITFEHHQDMLDHVAAAGGIALAIWHLWRTIMLARCL